MFPSWVADARRGGRAPWARASEQPSAWDARAEPAPHLEADERGDAGFKDLLQLLLAHLPAGAAAGLDERVAPQEQVPGQQPVCKAAEGRCRLVAVCVGVNGEGRA